jgi:hypothetical protein
MELQKLKNTNVLVRVIFDQKSKNTRLTIDLKEIGKGSDGENKWASSSARIEHQPPKLGVEGSNPSPPAIINFLSDNSKFFTELPVENCVIRCFK